MKLITSLYITSKAIIKMTEFYNRVPISIMLVLNSFRHNGEGIYNQDAKILKGEKTLFL